MVVPAHSHPDKASIGMRGNPCVAQGGIADLVFARCIVKKALQKGSLAFRIAPRGVGPYTRYQSNLWPG